MSDHDNTAMRAEINRMIGRERTAAQVCAIRPKNRKALADRAEAARRAMYPALAEFRDFALLTTPVKSAKSVRS